MTRLEHKRTLMSSSGMTMLRLQQFVPLKFENNLQSWSSEYAVTFQGMRRDEFDEELQRSPSPASHRLERAIT